MGACCGLRSHPASCSCNTYSAVNCLLHVAMHPSKNVVDRPVVPSVVSRTAAVHQAYQAIHYKNLIMNTDSSARTAAMAFRASTPATDTPRAMVRMLAMPLMAEEVAFFVCRGRGQLQIEKHVMKCIIHCTLGLCKLNQLSCLLWLQSIVVTTNVQVKCSCSN